MEAIVIEHLTKTFTPMWPWQKASTVLTDVSLRVRQGEIFGFLGHNGAGKTTTFYMIVGLIQPAAGRIVLDGEDITRLEAYYPTRQEAARRAFTVVQVSALSVGLLALVLLVLLRTDLISSWQRATPVDAPNRFVINIQPDQAAPFQATRQAQGVQRYDWYPMVRGRLVAVNERPVQPQDYPDERAQRLVEREFNLSYAASAPGHNRVVGGRWVDNEPGAMSVEEGMANNLGLKLGDRLTFDIAGVPVSATVRSVRQVDWSSMRVNFFAMFTQGTMPDLPQTYISAYKAPAVPGFDNALVKAYPNITNVDMTATLDQVQRVLGQVIRAVEFLFGFTLAAGLVVLFAAVTATRGEREREFAILRAVGAQSALLRQVQRAELAGVGVLAGVLASVMATAVGWALARYVFVFEWTPSVWVPVGGAVAGAACRRKPNGTNICPAFTVTEAMEAEYGKMKGELKRKALEVRQIGFLTDSMVSSRRADKHNGDA